MYVCIYIYICVLLYHYIIYIYIYREREAAKMGISAISRTFWSTTRGRFNKVIVACSTNSPYGFVWKSATLPPPPQKITGFVTTKSDVFMVSDTPKYHIRGKDILSHFDSILRIPLSPGIPCCFPILLGLAYAFCWSTATKALCVVHWALRALGSGACALSTQALALMACR